MHSLKLACRFLWKDRTFAALATIVLTIGIGGVATQFGVANGMFLRLPTFPEAERLVSISPLDSARIQSVGGAASPDLVAWRAGQHSFEELAMVALRAE